MQCTVIGTWRKYNVGMNEHQYQDSNLQCRDTGNIPSVFGRREKECLSHSESNDSLFVIPTSVTALSVVITLPLMVKKKIMEKIIPGKDVLMNLQATFKEQSTQNLANPRRNRAY